MAQSTATIESVWAAKGNSNSSAIVSTADGKYPALDGSLITNVGAGDLLATNNLSELTATASVARTNLELGATDTVEFGALVPPAGTTAEIDAVSAATIGQVMIDTDLNRIVRFTGASAYEVVTSKTIFLEDENAASSPLTLDDSKFLESGVVADGAGEIFVKSSTESLSGSFSGATSYGNFSNVWYELDGFTVESGAVIIPNRTTQVKGNGNTVTFDFHRAFINQATAQNMFSIELVANVTYSIELELDFMDFQKSNAHFDLGFTGTYSSAKGSLKLEDTRARSTLVNTRFSNLSETDALIFTGAATPMAVSSENFNRLHLNLIIVPSVSGVWTFKPRQVTASAKPLYTSKGSLKVSN